MWKTQKIPDPLKSSVVTCTSVFLTAGGAAVSGPDCLNPPPSCFIFHIHYIFPFSHISTDPDDPEGSWDPQEPGSGQNQSGASVLHTDLSLQDFMQNVMICDEKLQ